MWWYLLCVVGGIVLGIVLIYLYVLSLFSGMRWCLVALLLSASGALAGDLPDPALTPGVTRAITLKQVCHTKWGKDARAVTAAMKRKVFEEYGLTGNTDKACVPDASGRRCEIDHLISRELGGADDVHNLWPQSYGSRPWNAVRKDQVENRLHAEVCAGHITLRAAQDAIKTDWREVYKQYFGQPPG